MLRSEGALLYSDLVALHRSLQVFLGNCDQLLGFMSSHLDDPLTEMRLWAVQNREGFNRFLDEVERLYHNVAAAALSLRDHSYRVRNHWLQPVPSDTLREEHDERVRRCSQSRGRPNWSSVCGTSSSTGSYRGSGVTLSGGKEKPSRRRSTSTATTCWSGTAGAPRSAPSWRVRRT
jgi:hypothetical protein